jgi:hypothetical protein
MDWKYPLGVGGVARGGPGNLADCLDLLVWTFASGECRPVNAAERAIGIRLAAQIAATVNLFKGQFPDVRTDLRPWMNDDETQELVDPDSIDIGFHFPGLSRPCGCRSMLVQIRLFEDPIEGQRRAIGVEVAGYDHRGQQWRFSTVNRWQFGGAVTPQPAAAEKLKVFCRQVLELFNQPSEESEAS